jgi:hypothetical protein
LHRRRPSTSAAFLGKSPFQGGRGEINENLVSTFGFYPGPIDYWLLVTDWRGGAIAIMLAIGALIVGFAFRGGSPAAPPADVLPTHASPSLSDDAAQGSDSEVNIPIDAIQISKTPNATDAATI